MVSCFLVVLGGSAPPVLLAILCHAATQARACPSDELLLLLGGFDLLPFLISRVCAGDSAALGSLQAFPSDADCLCDPLHSGVDPVQSGLSALVVGGFQTIEGGERIRAWAWFPLRGFAECLRW